MKFTPVIARPSAALLVPPLTMSSSSSLSSSFVNETRGTQAPTGSGRFARRPGFSCMDRLSEITAPTLIVVGESDIPDVHAHVGVIQARISESKRVVLPHAGHLADLEVPDEFNRLVLEFLQAVE